MSLEKSGGKIPDESNDSRSNGDVEGKPKLKYPLAVIFIIGNEFCERFNYYGMRTILVLYLSRQLGFSQTTATVIFHAFTMLVYFMCIFGAIIADSWLGKFKTIFYLSIVYTVGSLVVSLGAMPPLHLPGVEITIVGLLLIAIGSGGIKPCVSAFGGDQFKLPEQIKQMATYFSLFYFAINSGSLISTTVTPLLRENVYCFDQPHCYPLAFGVPAILMAASIVIFVLGRSLYTSKPPAGNMFLLVSKAIGTAISTRCKEKKISPKEHWLDYAEKKYDRKLIEDIKVLLRVLVLFIPLPIFWALFDQQGSRWTFQATRMDGDFGSFVIQPDQLQLINPLLILIFIPLYDVAFYPLLAKVGISRPLQKLTAGGILAGVAFCISGVVELQLEKTYPLLPSNGAGQLRLFNGIQGCGYNVKIDYPDYNEFHIPNMGYYEEKSLKVEDKKTVAFQLSSNITGCPSLERGQFNLKSATAMSYFITTKDGKVVVDEYIDKIEKPEKGLPEVRVLSNVKSTKDNITWTAGSVSYSDGQDFRGLKELFSSKFKVSVGTKELIEVQLKQGGVYTLIVSEAEKTANKFETRLIAVTEPNSMNILWLIPQFFVMTLGEVMYSVTGLEFSYAQAPLSMKSVLQACWQLTVAIGNLVVIIVAEAKIFNSQASEFFLFAGLMFVDMCLFMFLAYRYKSHNPNKEEQDS